jgi:hypothetical protein
MHLIEVTPSPCTICGRGNTPNSDGTPNVFVDLERDVNWNDPVILCEDCAIKVGSIVGMLTTTDKQDMDRVVAARDKTIHELEADNEQLRTAAVNRKRAPTRSAA